MRIWDIDPGYLNDKSLLGEHRELHGMVNVLEQNKKGYSRHPETIRWKNHLEALKVRHQLLEKEMLLRGFNHKSPLLFGKQKVHWPINYIDSPEKQFSILGQKYQAKPGGRIPLPSNCQSLWASHKYSVMARSYTAYKAIGRKTATGIDLSYLTGELVNFLRTPPEPDQLHNALLHMWGYISKYSEYKPDDLKNSQLVNEIQQKAIQNHVSYLLHSTALGELAHWVSEKNSHPAGVLAA